MFRRSLEVVLFLLCCIVGPLPSCLAGVDEVVSLVSPLTTVSEQQVASVSSESSVSTIVESRDVFAIGVWAGSAYKTRVWKNADEAYGVFQGLLVFSRAEKLYLGDLRTNEERPILQRYRVAAAAWQPGNKTLAVSFRSKSSNGVLLYAVDQDAARILVETGAAEGPVRWSTDGKTVFYWGVDETSPIDPAFLVANDIVRRTVRRTAVTKEDLAGLATVDESGLRAAFLGSPPEHQPHFRFTVQSAGNSESSDPVSLVALRYLSNDLILLEREEGGHELFVWSPTIPSVVTRVGAKPTGLTRTPRAETADRNEAAAQPAASTVSNDEISGATLITSLPYAVSQDTTFATANFTDPKDCVSTTSHTVWYRFVPNFTGIVRVSTFGSDYDTVLAAYAGSTSLGAQLGCNDDTGSQVQSEIAFPVTSGQSYLIEASRYGSSSTSGMLILNMAANAGLAQMTSPAPGSLLQGSNVIFSWSAAVGAIGYQLLVGTSPGASDIFYGPTTLSQNATVTIPATGSLVYVRLETALRCYPCLGNYTVYQFIDYVYLADSVTSGAITTPSSGSTFPGATQSFYWSAGTSTSAYALSVGSSPGANDIYSGTWTSAQSQLNVPVPTDGRTIYARLWSLQGVTTHYNDYTYIASSATGVKSAMSTPSPGSTLIGGSAAFTWTAGTNVTSNVLLVGSRLGAADIANWPMVNGQFVGVAGLPTDGRTLFVQLGSYIQGNYQWTDYTYVAATGTRLAASIISPSPGTNLASTVPFTWSTGTDVAFYRLWVGNSAGSGDIYHWGGASATSTTATGIPTDGRALYVRLSSLIYGAWVDNDYTYNAQSQGLRAVVSSPAPGSTLFDSAVAFTWNSVVAASGYWLDVGTSTGQGNICASGAISAVTFTCPAIPIAVAGVTAVYVRLWTQIAGIWQYNDYSYSTPVKAVLAAPIPGSTLGGTSQNFAWSAGTGASAYRIDVGTTQGQIDIFSANVGTVTNWTVPGIPATGITIYVRLWSLFTGTLNWQYNDYVYTASTAQAKAVLVTPLPGSTLTGSSVSFNWTTVTAATGYWLDVGTALGVGDLCASGAIVARAYTCPKVPINGSIVYIRLWTQLSSGWQHNDYTYVAANLTKAVMVSPRPAGILPGSTVTFTWAAGTGASAYWLDVGLAQGVGNIWAGNVGSNTAWTVGGIPTNGVPVYVRLWSLLGSSWVFYDYSYTAAVFQKAVMTAPTPGTTLGPAAVFSWTAGAGATAYWLDVGTAPGQGNIFAGNVGTVTSLTVTGIPTKGGSVYVRLWSQINGTWLYNDYLYSATTF